MSRRVVCVSLLIYIRTNTHAHTRTRGPAVGLEPRETQCQGTRLKGSGILASC